MGKIIIDTSSERNYLVKRYSDISILKNEIIQLTASKNVLEDLPYGFYFNTCSPNVSSIVFNDYDTSRIVNMDSMFYGRRRLKELDLSSFDTRNVTNMEWMFGSCLSLQELDLSTFDTCNVTTMAYMFIGCENLKELDLSSFDTRNVTTMEYMFYDCENLEKLDLSNFDMSNIRDMGHMFYGCTNLRHIKCKKIFKKWCLINKDTISLPESIRKNGNGIWEIID